MSADKKKYFLPGDATNKEIEALVDKMIYEVGKSENDKHIKSKPKNKSKVKKRTKKS